MSSLGAGAGVSSWSLRRRLVALLVAVGVLLAALLAGAALLLAQTRTTQNRVVTDYFIVIRAGSDGYAALLDTETAVRGYALTGDKTTLEPMQSLQSATLREESRQVQRILQREPALRAAYTAAAASAVTWYRQWVQPVLAKINSSGARSVGDADILRGKALFDRVRVDYTAYLNTLRQRRTAARHTLDNQTRLLFGIVVATLVVAALLAVSMWVALLRWVVRPLDHLAEETRAVRAGDLDHAVDVTGPPEIESLAHDVEAMRGALVTRLAEVRRAGDEIEAGRALLESQAEDLQRSNRDLEQFAYVASHDLQEPLRKVASFCQLLQKRYGGQLDDRADQYINFAVDGAKRMQQLINDLLAFSRVGRLSAGTAPVLLESCLALALRNLEVAIADTGATVTHDPLPVVTGEAPLLTQLLQNLIANAVKFRRPDEPPLVRIGVREVEGAWEFSCVDNGIGIDQQYAERVFVIFQRLHPKEEYEGTGIGLALCRRIVEFHGGEIWIEPSAGADGTTVRWTLPMPVQDDSGAPALVDEGARA